jgi:small subunit ribosomal protein S20
MANRRSSIKKIRVDKRRFEHNLSVRSELKTAARKVRELLSAKKKPDAEQAVRALFSKLDKAVKKNILHKNRASRLKSRFHSKLRALIGSKYPE